MALPPFLFNMVSELIIDIPDTFNVKTLRVNDASFYNPSIKVECATVSITPPGYLEPVNFNVKGGFSIVFNSSNLKLAKVKTHKQLVALPDGIYTVRYSIKPNDKLWVEYDYLRTNVILQDLNKQRCALKLTPYPMSKETRAKIKHLREIEDYITVAKLEVEECGNRKKGMELYKYAASLLSEQCKTC